MFKKGDKVKIIGGYCKGETGEIIDFDEDFEQYLVNGENVHWYTFGKNLELVSTDDTYYIPSQNGLNHYLTDGHIENLFKDKNDLLKPNHYQGKNGDLFDEWYERYPFEVFRIVLLATAERYFRRYHLKDGLDGLNKGIEVMKRLEEYELKEKNND